MNAVTKVNQQGASPAPSPQRTQLDVFMASVLPKARQEVMAKILPAHVKPERFLRNFSIAVNQHPKLLGCEPGAVFNEVSKAAALGLYLDPQLGEAYLITGWVGGKTVPQLRLGYRGLIKLARQSGEIKSIYAHEVHANDDIEILLGTEKTISHRPNFTEEDRGQIVLYYAVVKYANGETDFEPMTIGQIHKIRDKSDGWKAFKEGKIKSTPWGTDEEEMAKKTVLRRLLKRVPQSPELADAMRADDEDGPSQVSPVNQAIAHKAADALQISDHQPAAMVVEVVEDEPEQTQQIAPETIDEGALQDADTSDMFPGDRK